MSIARIGFACKWIDRPDQTQGIKPTDHAKQYNTGAVTLSWLNRQPKDLAEQKLWDIIAYNIEATSKLVHLVSTLEPSLRMVRLSSDILPAYTAQQWTSFWTRTDVLDYCSKHLKLIGDCARRTNTRLSFHPGQFTVLASANADIVDRSIKEFEYHADMARWLGYGQTFQDLKINVHISGKAGPEGIRDAYKKLSNEARNCITIENEENSWGLDDCLTLSDLLPIVLDIHHHWVREGMYIDIQDSRIQQVLDSWRGIRPTCHYSVSREDYLVGHSNTTLPDHTMLLAAGYKKQKLRAHSDFFWNTKVNEWALSFLEHFDIMCESKGKNLASIELYNQYLKQ